MSHCLWRVLNMSTLPMEGVEVFHAAHEGTLSVDSVEVFNTAWRRC